MIEKHGKRSEARGSKRRQRRKWKRLSVSHVSVWWPHTGIKRRKSESDVSKLIDNYCNRKRNTVPYVCTFDAKESGVRADKRTDDGRME